MKKLLLLVLCIYALSAFVTGQSKFVSTLSPNSLAILEYDTSYLVAVNTSHYFSGYMMNYGPNTVNSINIDYSVNGGPTVVYPLSSLSFAPSSSDNYTVTPAWTPSAIGTYTVKIWLDAINGPYTNAQPNWDTAIKTFMVVDSVVPKQVLIESFMQASCGDCFFSAPFDDQSIQTATQESLCNSVRYHVNWPGVDYMNSVTQNPFVGTRVGYYGVSGVPDFKVDGSDIGGIDVQTIQQAQVKGSPFRIRITSFTYDSATNTYNAQASLKSFGAFPAGLSVRAVLTVDTLKYTADQSTEDPESSFAPPIGSGSNADNTYTYVMNFPYVAEAMMPSAVGITLGTITPESTKTLAFSWTKDHPWSANPTVNMYDSTFPGVHLTVFVQTDIALTPVAAKYVFQSESSDIPFTSPAAISNIKTENMLFSLYPNPANSVVTMSFNLNASQSVSTYIYNILGENLIVVRENEMAAGQHSIPINCSELKQGVYFVKISTGNSYSVQKLVIER